MAKSQQTFNKKEKEKQKVKKREEKERKKEERKANSAGGGLENMLVYVDENGNFTSTAPDPAKKEKIKADQIEIGVPKRLITAEDKETVRKGKVTFFNSSKGFGFIKAENSDESIFVHVNGLKQPIAENDIVTFQVEQGQRGLVAVEVTLVK
ncbi:cold shock domain-containing protein [soil metagenome]